MQKFDLIVSIVVYKPKIALLEQTLKSLTNSGLNLKILLVDNSPRPVPPEAYKLAPDIEYSFTGDNLGYGRAHNQNIFQKKYKADYFLVLNPDVFFDTELLSSLLERMNLDPQIGLCIPKICYPSGTPQAINRLVPRPQDYLISFLSNKLKTDFFKTSTYQRYLLNNFDTEKPFICPTISGCFMLFRTEALCAVGGFDERYFLYLEDTDLSRRVSENHRVVVFSDLIAFHHWSRGAHKNIKLFIVFLRSLVSYYNKWGWFFDSRRESLNSKVKHYNSMYPDSIYEKHPNSALNPSTIFDSLS
jgi:GT2 family glycosyltransferase